MNVQHIILSTCLLLAACSAPKNYYYFTMDSQHQKIHPYQQPGASNELLVADRSGNKNTLVLANAAPEPPKTRPDTMPAKKNYERISNKEEKAMARQVKKDLRLEKKKQEAAEISARLEPAYNWAAIAGFAGVILGILLAGKDLWPLAIAGALLCILGLKSERRKLAKAGLTIILVGCVLLVVVFVVSFIAFMSQSH